VEANTLNLEHFLISSSATKPALAPSFDLSELNTWSGPGHPSGVAYVIEDNFGIYTPSTGAFAAKDTFTLRDDLRRQIVVDAVGLIEHFSASNASAVMAQSTMVLKLPRFVYLKQGPEIGQRRNEPVPMFLSDPFDSLFQRLLDFENADRIDSESVVAPVALQKARQVLDAACQERVVPTKLLRDSNGVFFYFSNHARYVEIECDNDGDIGFVMSDRSGNPAVWLSESSRLRSDLARVRAFLL
jgi:hypothetical protein